MLARHEQDECAGRGHGAPRGRPPMVVAGQRNADSQHDGRNRGEHGDNEHGLGPAGRCRHATAAVTNAATAHATAHSGALRHRETMSATANATMVATTRHPISPPIEGPATTSAAATANGATDTPVASESRRGPRRVAPITAIAASHADATAARDPVHPAGPSTAWAPAMAASDGDPHRTITEINATDAANADARRPTPRLNTSA